MAIPTQLQDRLRLPLICSPMFIVSGRALAIAQCRAGVVGSFPSLNARDKAELEPWIEEVKAATAQPTPDGRTPAPFAVNLICHPSNARLEHDADVCLRQRVPILLTSLHPPGDIVTAAHAYGGLVFHDVTTVRHAAKAVEQGVDGLVLVCSGAGGHAGTLSPFALLPEVRSFFNGTIILAGAIMTGRTLLAARALGADLAYAGTRFLATAESGAAPAYKQMVVESAAKDVVYTSYFSGVGANYLVPSIVAAGLDVEEVASRGPAKPTYVSGSRHKAKAWKDIWGAGQGVGAVHAVETVGAVVDRLEREYQAARADLCGAGAC
jgi:nitronate monooxygenase